MRRSLAAWTLAVVSAVSLKGQAGNGQTGVTFRCEDLPSAGLILVPEWSPAYDPLLTDVQQRIDHPSSAEATIPEQIRGFIIGKISPGKRPTSAILLNRSGKSIAAMELVWRYEDSSGQTYSQSWANTFGKALLLPFSTQALLPKMRACWNTILPGSKRYLGEYEMAGDNTDVRTPGSDEVWKGGGVFGIGGGRTQVASARLVTLTLDGVFFSDGEFVGPNRLWESITSEAKVRMDVARTARYGIANGIPATDILDIDIGKIVGPALILRPGPVPDTRARAAKTIQQTIAGEIDRQRRSSGDGPTVASLAAQADTQLPNFRKR